MTDHSIDFDALFRRIPLLRDYRATDFKIDKLNGFTNQNFRLRNQNIDWVLRIPKPETNCLINRDFEAANRHFIQSLAIAPDILWQDKSGLSLSVCCSQGRSLTQQDMSDPVVLQNLIEHVNHLHGSKLQFYGEFDVFEVLAQYYRQIPIDTKPALSRPFQKAQSIWNSIARIGHKNVPSHNDLVLDNLLVDSNQRIFIIDWEYAAMASPYWDLATLCNTARFDSKASQQLLALYRGQSFQPVFEILLNYQYLLQLLSACWLASFSIDNLNHELDWLNTLEARLDVAD